MFDKFDRSNLDHIRHRLNETLGELSQELNIQFNVGRITFSDKTFGCRLEAILENGESADKVMWDKHCYKYGLTEDDYGQTFKMGNGRTVKTVTIKPRNRKYPIIVEDVENRKRYKMAPIFVKAAIDKGV